MQHIERFERTKSFSRKLVREKIFSLVSHRRRRRSWSNQYFCFLVFFNFQTIKLLNRPYKKRNESNISERHFPLPTPKNYYHPTAYVPIPQITMAVMPWTILPIYQMHAVVMDAMNIVFLATSQIRTALTIRRHADIVQWIN